jgi:hypothetical protein
MTGESPGGLYIYKQFTMGELRAESRIAGNLGFFERRFLAAAFW